MTEISSFLICSGGLNADIFAGKGVVKMVDSTLYAIFRDELLRREEILWAGQPDPRILFSRSDIFSIPVGIAFTLFSIEWESETFKQALNPSSKADASWLLPLFGVPFVLIGLYLAVGRFFYKVWNKKRTYYAVTNKRILVVKNSRRRELRGAYLEAIPVINRSIRPDGHGTIIFGNTPPGALMSEDSGFDFLGSHTVEHAPSFRDINDAEKVYRLVLDLRKSREPS
jgi:hypothetical protein